MDASITKRRIGNLLSYDWLKIIAVVLLAILLLNVLFTSLATRATPAQTFYVYAYTDVTSGSAFSNLESRKGEIFSYEILSVVAEDFSGNEGVTVYSTRRGAGMGDVMFVTDEPTFAEDGSEIPSTLSQIVANEYTIRADEYLKDCERYLIGFFGTAETADGEDRLNETGEIDAAKAEECFRARNTGDKRFKTEESVAAGIESEKARLTKLRTDYLAVRAAIDRGAIRLIAKTDGNGTERYVAFGFSLTRLTDFCGYTTMRDGKNVLVSDNLALVQFDNNGADGDMHYETVSFLNFLVTKYENA